MPRGDGTGPFGQGSGRGSGRGQNTGRGRMGGPFSAGPGGDCVCPKCGATSSHKIGQPCTAVKCPKCGAKMTRK